MIETSGKSHDLPVDEKVARRKLRKCRNARDSR
jgi:hypothetical protein